MENSAWKNAVLSALLLAALDRCEPVLHQQVSEDFRTCRIQVIPVEPVLVLVKLGKSFGIVEIEHDGFPHALGPRIESLLAGHGRHDQHGSRTETLDLRNDGLERVLAHGLA